MSALPLHVALASLRPWRESSSAPWSWPWSWPSRSSWASWWSSWWSSWASWSWPSCASWWSSWSWPSCASSWSPWSWPSCASSWSPLELAVGLAPEVLLLVDDELVVDAAKGPVVRAVAEGVEGDVAPRRPVPADLLEVAGVVAHDRAERARPAERRRRYSFLDRAVVAHAARGARVVAPAGLIALDAHDAVLDDDLLVAPAEHGLLAREFERHDAARALDRDHLLLAEGRLLGHGVDGHDAQAPPDDAHLLVVTQALAQEPPGGGGRRGQDREEEEAPHRSVRAEIRRGGSGRVEDLVRGGGAR